MYNELFYIETNKNWHCGDNDSWDLGTYTDAMSVNGCILDF